MIDFVRLVLDFGYYLFLPTVIVLLVAAGLALRYGLLEMVAAVVRAIVARIGLAAVAGALCAPYLVAVIYASFLKAAGQVAPGSPLDLVWLSQFAVAIVLVSAILAYLMFADGPLGIRDLGLLGLNTALLAGVPLSAMLVAMTPGGIDARGIAVVAAICLVAYLVLIAITHETILKNLRALRGSA